MMSSAQHYDLLVVKSSECLQQQLDGEVIYITLICMDSSNEHLFHQHYEISNV